jgi:hypothetical protein
MKRAFLIAAVIACSISTLGVASAAKQLNSSGRSYTIAVDKSPWWAGYIAVPRVGGAKAFKYITATFKVPSMNCKVTPGQQGENNNVVQFVGFGGWKTSYFQAVGIQEGCQRPISGPSTPYYTSSYWNMIANSTGYPAPGTPFSVNPGDTIFVSVAWNAPAEQVTYKMTDQTTGAQWQKTALCYTYCGTSSAEVITAISGLNWGTIGDGTTPDFKSVSFSAIKATDTAQSGAEPLANTAWNLAKVVEYGTVTSRIDVQPGKLTTTTTKPLGSTFTNTWERQN